MMSTHLSSPHSSPRPRFADRDFQFLLDRRESLERASAAGNKEIELRVRAAVGEAGAPDVSTGLISEASELRFPPAEGTYVCLRGARYCAWNGQLDKAKSLYRLATKLGAEAGHDLDVENALWSLTVICQLEDSWAELFETHRAGAFYRGFSLLRQSELPDRTAFVSIPGKSPIA